MSGRRRGKRGTRNRHLSGILHVGRLSPNTRIWGRLPKVVGRGRPRKAFMKTWRELGFR
jgi:ribosomal protein L15